MRISGSGAKPASKSTFSAGVNTTRMAHLAMLLFAILISTSFTVGAAITGALEPVALTFLRFLMAAIIFAVLLAINEPWRWPKPADLGRYGFIGSLLVIYFVTMFEALRLSPPVNLGAVFTLAPLMTAVISVFLLNQTIGGVLGAGLIAAASGALCVVFEGSPTRLFDFSVGSGEYIFFLGCFAYAAYAPAVRWLHRGESILALTFWTIVAGTVILGVYGVNTILGTNWSAISARVFGGIAYLAVATTAISFYLIKFASLRLPSVKVMAYTYLIPAFVVFQVALTGHGWRSIPVIGGIAVITAATLVLQRA